LGFSRFDGESTLRPTTANASRWALVSASTVCGQYVPNKLFLETTLLPALERLAAGFCRFPTVGTLYTKGESHE